MGNQVDVEGTRVIELPPIMDISTAASVKELFLEGLGGGVDLVLNAEAIEKCTSPGIQLLVALDKSLASQQHRMAIENPSEIFESACKLTGLEEQYNQWVGANG